MTKFLHNSRKLFSTSSKIYDNHYDVVIVGGGIVGLATAQELIFRHPTLKFGLVEKESALSTHQTGHNSGVIHAGIYYKPGSLMAKLCLEGMKSTYKYCDKYKIPYKKVGKLVVATDETEVGRLLDLYKRALTNQVPDIKLLNDESEIKQYEPECRGVKAIWSPWTGIVDWALVAQKYGENFVAKGGNIKLNYKVTDIKQNDDRLSILNGNNGEIITTNYVLTCAGLFSDHVAAMTGCSSEPKIVPFRGEYLLLSPEKSKKLKTNIYPVPDPRLPFLGVHFTPRMNGDIWLGPNAVLAFKREGYTWFDLSIKDLIDVLKYPGFYRLARKYFDYGFREILRSIHIGLIIKELRKFVPMVNPEDISRGPAGVRAQAMNREGDLVGDFVFDDSNPKILHCRNAPSPGATSSLAIGRMMADRVERQFGLPSEGKNAELY